MVCKDKPLPESTLTCKTCTTAWHVTCLSSPPETLASTLQWDCPDCSTLFTVAPVQKSGESGDLIASIRAIEADGSLTEQEKAKKRQDLLSRGVGEAKSRDCEVFDLFDGSLNCSFCMQLPERPVTTPCGHNFCLKCFQKWVGQGKRTCAKCRTAIPSKMASQPRINSSIVVAIRMARMSRSSITTTKSLKVYNFVHNQNRPDKAFTTERAKYGGMANACSGKIFVTVPSDHFGPILAENDPERNQGVLVGECWEDRMECRQWGVHLPHVAGIAGQSDYGAQSVALSGGYQDDEDHGEWFLYTGSGGRDLSGNKRTNKDQSFDQKFEKYNEALRVSCRKGYPVRVVRSHKEKRSSYAPETGVRYDGVYRIEKCWRKIGIQGFKVCRYLFVRCDNEPAPWTSDEHGDRPRALPIIKELKNATDITERKENPSWDYDGVGNCWKWKRPPPMSRKPADKPISGKTTGDGDPEEVKFSWKPRKQEQNSSVRKKLLREKLLKEFSCLICREVMILPLTTPCAHNFCKLCLEGAFAGQTFVKERTCEGRRTLRTQKNIMKCPSCPMEISDFLQNPQVNRELMSVIETLRKMTEESTEEAEDTVEELSKEESASTEKPEAGVEVEVCIESTEVLEDGKKAIQDGPTKEMKKCNDAEHAAGAEKIKVCIESAEVLENGKKAIQDSATKEMKKANDAELNQNSPLAKSDAVKRGKRGRKIENETPGDGKEDLQTLTTERRAKRKKDGKEDFQTPTTDRLAQLKKDSKDDFQTPTDSTTKRKKVVNDDCGSSRGGVRTRSMQAKELLDKRNESRSEKTKVKQSYKQKKTKAVDSASKAGGVKTRSSKR